ncbi:hypothetical protein FFV09_00910 [Saccharibacillus brassicae]|uniref:Recombinase zinc beta ribbon domain-containing protein n=1 Tax=Saccharibacillus brassicae TaxID=2583377 RepID=A0A4Y6USC3_SACBS|nr:hypothetical protein FFV09_00910 [Saccharibacillus brassicae]
MLRNPILKGYQRYNYINDDKHLTWKDLKLQPFNPDYKILEEEDFDRVQEIIDSRSNKNNKQEINTPTKSKLLLSGIVKCGYCGGNLSVDHSITTNKRKDGTIQKSKVMRYVCKRARHLGNREDHACLQFGAKKYEKEAEIVVKDFISKANKEDFVEVLDKFQKENVVQKDSHLAKLKKEIQGDYQELSAIKGLIIKVELGQSKLSFDTVESMLLEQEIKIAEKGKLIESLERETQKEKTKMNEYQEVLEEFDGWLEKYDEAELDTKKMMLSRVIRKISFKKDEIDLELVLPIGNTTPPEDQNRVGMTEDKAKITDLAVHNIPNSHRHRRPGLADRLRDFDECNEACQRRSVDGACGQEHRRKPVLRLLRPTAAPRRRTHRFR